jgi:hypothetical protein
MNVKVLESLSKIVGSAFKAISESSRRLMLRQSEKVRVRMFTAILHVGRTVVAAVLFKFLSHIFFFDKKYNDPKVIKDLYKAVEEEFSWVKGIPAAMKLVYNFINK